MSYDHVDSTPFVVQVNCGNLESLLNRLVKVSHYGLDFLNTFLMTFHLYTTAHHVLDFLISSYHECLSARERKRSGSITPQDAVRDARGERAGLVAVLSGERAGLVAVLIAMLSGDT